MTQTSPAVASQDARIARESELRAQAAPHSTQSPIAQAGQPPIIQVRNLEKTYTTARGALTLFRGLDFDIQTG